MKYLILGIIVIVGIYGIHRLASWAEDRGWIYYRKKKAGGGMLGNALLELQAFLEPSKRHIIEERKKMGGESQESGDKPKSGDPFSPGDG